MTASCMMWNMRTLIITTAMILIAGTCAADTFKLKIGESYTFEADQFTVGFTDISGDSRCPRNVTCFWEGDAAVLLTAGTREFTLHTAFGFQHTIEISGYTIRLNTVAPYPENEAPIDPEAYLVNITATKTTALPTTATTWGAIKNLYR